MEKQYTLNELIELARDEKEHARAHEDMDPDPDLTEQENLCNKIDYSIKCRMMDIVIEWLEEKAEIDRINAETQAYWDRMREDKED